MEHDGADVGDGHDTVYLLQRWPSSSKRASERMQEDKRGDRMIDDTTAVKEVCNMMFATA